MTLVAIATRVILTCVPIGTQVVANYWSDRTQMRG